MVHGEEASPDAKGLPRVPRGAGVVLGLCCILLCGAAIAIGGVDDRKFYLHGNGGNCAVRSNRFRLVYPPEVSASIEVSQAGHCRHRRISGYGNTLHIARPCKSSGI